RSPVDGPDCIHSFAAMRMPRLAGPVIGSVLVAAAALARDVPPNAELVSSMARGQLLYLAHCAICHGATGDGVPGTFPPLVKSDWLAAHRSGAIRAIVNGLKEEIMVNGARYRG